VVIGDRLREMREEKKLSQGDIEKRTGLLRCYISRVENGHTVPAIETLEKLARALESPLYDSFMTARSRPAFRTFPSGSRLTTSPGGVPAKMHAISTSFAVS
jgi:transcriptional regulator with XRE-family HTH domain